MLVSVATDYNNALLVIENANVGWAVIQIAIDRGYSNLYYSYRQDAYIDENIHLAKGYDLKNKSDMVPGFSTALVSLRAAASSSAKAFTDALL